MFKDKVILITGGSGSLGRALLERLQGSRAKEIRVLSRSEKGQLALKRDFSNYPIKLEYILADVRDKFAVSQAVKGTDIVIHAAAFKFLDLAEKQARECTLTNVVGSLNILEAIVEQGGKVEKCIGISTDKVAYARNVYGASKHIMEKLFKEANGQSDTKFSCVRYGNVVGTTGSVATIWQAQKERGEAITITDKRMRRFFFSIDEAVDLVLYGLEHMTGGEVFVRKMKSYSLYEMAKEVRADNIVETGMRPGEKIFETLIADYEGEEYTSESEVDDDEIVRLT